MDASAPAPAAATPAPAAAVPPKQGPLNNADVEDWKNRINDVLARPSEHVNSKSPEDAGAWHSAFFGCFSPIDTCLMTWCLPCVTFGRTHHRLRKNGNLDGYEPINTSVRRNQTPTFLPSACKN